MRQRFNRRQRNYIILGLCSILLVMAAGYAAFRTQLTINGTSNISSEWKVLITDIQSSVLEGNATDAETPSHTDTTATFKTNLVSPGDSMQYTVTVENRGNIDAVLKTLSKTDSSNDAIIFEITGIEQGDTLKAHNSTTFNVTVTYNPEITNQPDNITSDLTITLDYVQAGTTDEGEVLPAETNLMRSYMANSQLDYHSDEYREKITSIEFLNNKNIPSEAVQSWDVSERQDGSVMAWIVNDTETEGYYKLYIGGDGGVTANPNSSRLFSKFINTKSIKLLNLDTSNVTDMLGMFNQCYSLTELDVSNFDTSNVTNMKSLFNECESLITLDLSSFDTSKVTDMMTMFSADKKIETIVFGKNFDTSNVNNMTSMFNQCENLTELDLTNFDTSKVKNMAWMFHGCKKLLNITFSKNFGSVATDMNQMFCGCTSLITLDLINFNTSNVTDMGGMFMGCNNLKMLNIKSFDTSDVRNMSDMFNCCTSLTELDLSSFDTLNVTEVISMFSGNSNLQTIYVGTNWNIDNAKKDGMFYSCGTDHVTLKSS